MGGIVFPPDDPRQPIDILLVQIRGRAMLKKHSFLRSRDGFAYSEVAAGTSPKVHPQKTRKRRFQHPGMRSRRRCGRLIFKVIGMRYRPSRAHLGVWRTQATPARRPPRWPDVFCVSVRHTRCRTQPRAELTPDACVPRGAFTGGGLAPARRNRLFLLYRVSAACLGGPANGTSNNPTSATQASRAQASLALRANAAFSTMGRR